MGFKWGNIKYCIKAAAVYGLIALLVITVFMFSIDSKEAIFWPQVFAMQAITFLIAYGVAFFICNTFAFAYGDANDFHAVIIIVAITYGIDRSFAFYNIPVTSTDILLNMILLFIPYIVWRHYRNKGKSKKIESVSGSQSYSLGRRIKTIIGMSLFIILGLGVAYMGFIQPMDIFSGVKAPPVHGYTLAALGMVFVTSGIVYMVDLFKS